MTFEQLKNSIRVKNGQLSINTQSLGGVFHDFLSQYYFYQGQVIEIDGVAKLSVDESLKTITAAGKSSYLNIPDVSTVAVFSILDNAEVNVQVRYTMMEGIRSATRWKFSDSFPSLPKESYNKVELPDLKNIAKSKASSYSTGSASNPASGLTFTKPKVQYYLDNLELTEADIIVSTHTYMDEQHDTEVVPGINFLGKMRPTGFLGILESFIPKMDPVTVFGKIVIPYDDTQMDMSTMNYDVSQLTQFPWEMEQYPPYGIYLNVKLGLDFKVGEAEFKDTYVRFFRALSPHLENSSSIYSPVTAFTGVLDIPSGDLSIDMVSILTGNVTALSIYGRFQGFSIENLSKLASICGPKNLTDQIPSSLADALGPLKKLELTDLGITLSWGARGVSFDEISLGIGMPDLDWRVWKDHIVVNGIGSKFYLQTPFTNLNTRISLWGKTIIEGAKVDVEGTKEGDRFSFTAMVGDAKMPLKKIMKKYVPGLPVPSNLTINSLQVNFSPGSYLGMSGSLAEKPDAWELDLGPGKLIISNVQFNIISLSESGGNAGSFRGNLDIGKNIKISTNYTIPGEFLIRGEAGVINFKEMLSKLTGKKVALPKGLDFTLTDASIMIKKGRTGLVLQLASQVEGFGFMAFELKKVNGTWGAAAGISMDPIKLSDIPGLKPLKPIEKVALMEDFTLVISTYDGPQFRFPDMASFNNPALPANNNVQMPSSAGGVVNGLNLYSKWKLDTGGKQTKLLKKLMGLDPVTAVTLQVSNPPTKASSMFTTVETKLNGKWPLTARVGLALSGKTPEFFAAGNTTVKINRKNYTFDIALSFVKTGAYFSGTMLGTVNLKPVKLSNLALMASMNWGGIPSIGFAGTIDSKNFSSSIALFFDSTDPSKSVFAGSVSDLNLNDIVTGIAGAKAVPDSMEKVFDSIELKGTGAFTIPPKLSTSLDDLDLAKVSGAFKKYGKLPLPASFDQVLLVVNKKGKKWSITNLYDRMKHYSLNMGKKGITVTMDAQIYSAPQLTRIGTLQFTEGFVMNGALSILGLTSATTIDISQNKGISIDSHLNKALTIYRKNFFQLSATGKSEEKGPRISISTYTQRNHPIKEFRNPHFYIDGRLYLMGTEGEARVSLTTKGFEFFLSNVVNEKLNMQTIKGSAKYSFAIEGEISTKGILKAMVNTNNNLDLKISLKGLGKLKLKTSVSGTVKLGFDSKKAYAGFEGKFKFKGENFKVKMNLKVESKDLKNITNLMVKEIEKIFTNSFKNAEKFTKFAKDGLIEGAESAEKTAKILKNTFKKSANESAKILKNGGHSMNVIGDALKDSFKIDSKAMQAALKGAGYAASSVNKYVNSKYKVVTKAVTKTTKTVSKSTKSAAKNVSKKSKKKAKKARKKARKAFK